MLITLFTDAGYDHRINAGVWACWAISSAGTIQHSGRLRGAIKSSGAAEAFAVVNGLHVALRAFGAARTPEDRLMVIAQTDCQEAINALSGSSRRLVQAHRIAVRAAAVLLDQHGCKIEYRHVPGHTGTDTPRTAINHWCDRACRKLLDAMRGEAGLSTRSAKTKRNRKSQKIRLRAAEEANA